MIVNTVETIPTWKLRLDANRAEWESHLKALGDTRWGHGHFKCTIEILDSSPGIPPDDALFACAHDWQDAWGRVERRPYWHRDELGQKHRYVRVTVYTD